MQQSSDKIPHKLIKTEKNSAFMGSWGVSMPF
jgi:hypothetical protein